MSLPLRTARKSSCHFSPKSPPAGRTCAFYILSLSLDVFLPCFVPVSFINSHTHSLLSLKGPSVDIIIVVSNYLSCFFSSQFYISHPKKKSFPHGDQTKAPNKNMATHNFSKSAHVFLCKSVFLISLSAYGARVHVSAVFLVSFVMVIKR